MDRSRCRRAAEQRKDEEELKSLIVA
jgi:hypothetical protein